MPSANDLVNIADCVTQIITTNDLGADFSAIRTFTPVYDPVVDAGIRIFVLPVTNAATIAARSGYQRTYTIMVGIYNKIGFDEYNSRDTAAIDAMLEFTSKVSDLLITNSTLLNPVASLIGVENSPAFDPQNLDQKDLFVTVIELKYTLFR